MSIGHYITFETADKIKEKQYWGPNKPERIIYRAVTPILSCHCFNKSYDFSKPSILKREYELVRYDEDPETGDVYYQYKERI